jgi:autotransporter translocation and assembly factor TamB
LAFLQTLTSRIKNVQGTLVFDIKLENTLKDPQSKGALRVLDGAFSIPQYGVNYNDLQLVMTIDTSYVEVNFFEAHSDKGVFKADGRLNYTREAIGDAHGSLKADNFLITRKRDLEVRINADIHGAGDVNGASYQGNITVVRSRFFLPALQQGEVLQLDEKPETKSAAADCTQTAIVVPVDPVQRWLQNLQGELKINIPRNTWIRGPELNVEIEGALDFLQMGEKLSLFGTVNLVRGTYELYGKRFDIERGQIVFEGDLQASPQIELVAHHVFRRVTDQSERGEKQTLAVNIAGDLEKPTISFALENEQLDEKDALAYLIFGVSFDQLRSGEREGLSQGLGAGEALSSAAQGVVAGLVAKQLEKTLGRSLDLDVIEFQSGQDISQSSVIVGKYITNDLFLSFSQDFGSPEGRIVSLEYEIAKFLFLQAAHGGEENKKTGFDLIWKLDW